MVQLALLITNKHRLLSVAAILDVFESVNRFYEKDGLPCFFDINLYHPNQRVVDGYGKYKISPISDSRQNDLILIPAFEDGEIAGFLQSNEACIPWLVQQFKGGSGLGSFCTGAFLLASTGLLNGKKATTHINATDALAFAFPKVQVVGHAVVTDQEGIYTSGGATNSFHLMLHLLQNYCGREMTLRVAKMFGIDMDRDQQAYFGTFTPLQNHGDDLVTMTQRKIESGYQQISTIEEMVQDIPSSRRNMVRRFKLATGITPIEYLQKTRIEAAKKLLEGTTQSIFEVMLNTGYNDLKAFRQLFKRSAGMTPKSYREKFVSGRRVEILS